MSNNIKVVARFRPCNSLEKSAMPPDGGIVIDFSEDQTSVNFNTDSQFTNMTGPESSGFTFDRVFDMKSQQADIFDYGVKGIVDDVLNGYNGTVFAYGQTGSGKTFTMMGASIEDVESRGVIPRITEQIFTSISNSSANLEYLVKCAYFEVYQERIRDLLTPSNDNLPIHEEKSKGVYIKGLSDYYVGNKNDVLEILQKGGLSRAVASTSMNAESSRSHSIFLITITQRNMESGTSKAGNLYLVDLAGSEKIGKTNVTGQSLEEAKKINKSLSALGMVINALTDGKSSHIPYRDSKLTRILQESLGGNSRTTLIINCSASSYNEAETLSTLRFGMRAKSIKNKARVNAELSPLELKALLKKAQADSSINSQYITGLEAEINIWRAGGSVPKEAWVSPSKNLVIAGAQSVSSSQTPQPRPNSALSSTLSRPDTPGSILDKDERDEFLRRENELTDILSAKEKLLQEQDKTNKELSEELSYFREQHASNTAENTRIATDLSETKLRMEKLSFDSKESSITVDMLRESNEELSVELKLLRQKLLDAQNLQKDSHNEEKDRKKAEKMANMMADLESTDSASGNDSFLHALHKLDNLDETVITGGPLSVEDLVIIRRKVLESQAIQNSTVEKLKSIEEENGLITRRKDELASRLSVVQSEYEEILGKTASAELSTKDTDTAKHIAEVSLTAKQDSQLDKMQELRQQINLRDVEIRKLNSHIESLTEMNAEIQVSTSLSKVSFVDRHLQQALDVTSAGTEGGKNLAESARELERTRRGLAIQLADFEAMKKSLMRDLQNRCEKVVELEIELDQYKENYANLDKAFNVKNTQKKMNLLERNLEQLTVVQKQLVEQNTSMKREVAIAERKLQARTERIQNLEILLQDADKRLALTNSKFEGQLKLVRERLEFAKAQRMANEAAAQGFGRVAKPLRGGLSSDANPAIKKLAEEESTPKRASWFFANK